MPAGTVLQAVAWYDNSKNNPHNPDPDAAVRWGDQTYDEMMVGFFDVAVRADLDKPRYFIRSNDPPSRSVDVAKSTCTARRPPQKCLHR